jgi:branched-chain amino acid transport system ATP-binding protein
LSVADRVQAGIGRSFQISNVLMDFTVLENAIIAEQARLQQSFRFLHPAFDDPDLQTGAHKILSRVGLDDRAAARASDLAHGERRMLELGAGAGHPAGSVAVGRADGRGRLAGKPAYEPDYQ